MGYEASGQLRVRNRIKTKCRTTRYEPNPRTYLVYHHTASRGDSENYIYTTDLMSIHYLIKRTGEVVRFTWETQCPWHAGRTLYGPPRGPGIATNQTGNADMLGIEIEHAAGERHPYDASYGEVSRYYPVAQLRALDMLASDIYDRSPNIVRTVSHAEIAYPRGRKPDPEYMKDHMDEQQIAVVRRRLGQQGGRRMYENMDNPPAPGTPGGLKPTEIIGTPVFMLTTGHTGWPIPDGAPGVVEAFRYSWNDRRVKLVCEQVNGTSYFVLWGMGEDWDPAGWVEYSGHR